MKIKRSSGVALVLTLTLVTLVTICILAFMGLVRWDRQSASLTSATARVESFGRSVGNVIMVDLLAEIRDGSENLGTAAKVSYYTRAGANALPQRVLARSDMAADPVFANLYKQSVPTEFYKFEGTPELKGYKRASTVGTWEPSRNQRVLSAERWNQPRLLTGTGFTSTEQLPRWIYFTQQAETDPAKLNPTAWSTDLDDSQHTSFVIGRAAYNVYEIAGCLDANVAGGLPAVAKPKLLASLAGSRPAQLTGFTDPDKLLNWRNAVTGADGTAFTQYATIDGLKAGFLDKKPGDRRFISRQDLISYALENPARGFDETALPYLTHFSRGLDRPSRPADTDGTLLGGYPARPAKINAPPLTARVAEDVTLKDGTKLSKDDPIAFRRFPLRRLALLERNSTSAKNDDQPIYRHFGLSRSNAGSPWVYSHGADNRILTLEEVALQKREPDFFEMLQAAINAGSLGGSGGPYDTGLNPKYVADTESLDENVYRQILKIGACLIDQYDEDDYPTEITIKDASGVATSSFGVENLPYLNEFGPVYYRPAELPRTKLRGYLQVEVWNPHQNAVNADPDLKLRVAVTKGKANLRLGNVSFSTGSGQDRFDALYNGPVAAAYGVSKPTSGSPAATTANLRQFMADYPDLVFKTASSTAGEGGITFSPEAPGVLEFTNAPQLQEPFTLTAPNDPAAVAQEGYPPFAYGATAGGSTSTTSIVDEETPESLKLQTRLPLPPPKAETFDSKTRVTFAGIMLAESTKPDDRVDGIPDQASFGVPAAGCWDVAVFDIAAAGALTVELQIKTPEGNWMPYQRFQNIRALNTSNRSGLWGDVSQGLNGGEWASVSFIRPVGQPKPNVDATPRLKLFVGYNSAIAIDPRTARFTWLLRDSYGPGSNGNFGTSTNTRIVGNGEDWMTSTVSPKAFYQLASNIPNHPSGLQYYKDPDGVVRRGDGEERPEVPADQQSNPIYSGYRTTVPYTEKRGKMEDRPVLLNRPFQSVAEMGYAFRDLPWKSLDFWTKDSGDGCLLDYFCIEETALDGNRRPLRAGVINPNTASAPVLKAVIEKTVRKELANTELTDAEVQAIADSIRASAKAQPLASIADLPSLADGATFPGSGTPILRKTEKEAFLRALAPVSEVNVWNVMIDVVAQTGRFAPNSQDLKQFVVQGEARYWIFAAIDRTTGEIVDTQYELVTQ
jgi:hypothetical protein